MEVSLNGKWALILGVSSGFGAASANAFAEAGMNILGVHLDRKSGMQSVEDLTAELESFGAQVRFFNINAADEVKRGEVLSSIKD